jgi:O-antigen/teichoic acid export membrane protein
LFRKGPPVSDAEQAAAPVADSPRLFRGETTGPALGVYLPTMAAFRFLGLVRNVVLAWLVSEGQFGLLLLSLLVVNVLAPVASLTLHEAAARYVPMFESRGALRAYLRRAVPLSLIVAATAASALALAADPVGIWLFHSLQAGPSPGEPAQVSRGVDEIVALTRWVAAAVFGMSVYSFLMGILRGVRMFRALSLMEITQTVLFTGGAIVVAWREPNSAKAIVVCYVAALLFVVAVFAVALRRRLRDWPEQQTPLADNESVAGRMLRFSLWTAVATLAWQTLQNYPTWYLNKIHGHAAIAVFGGIRSIAQGVLLAALPVITVVMTMVTRAWETEGRDAADRRFHLAFKTTVLLLFAGSAIVSAAKAQVIRLFPASFAPGEVVTQPLLLFFLLATDLTFLSVHFSLIEKTRRLMWPWVVGVVTNIVIAWLWVRPAPPGRALGMPGQLLPAAQAGVVAMAVALAVCLLLLRLERRPVDRGSWAVIVAGFALCLPWQATAAVAACLVILARPLVFTRAESVALREHGVRLWRFVRGPRRSTR